MKGTSEILCPYSVAGDPEGSRGAVVSPLYFSGSRLHCLLVTLSYLRLWTAVTYTID